MLRVCSQKPRTPKLVGGGPTLLHLHSGLTTLLLVVFPQLFRSLRPNLLKLLFNVFIVLALCSVVRTSSRKSITIKSKSKSLITFSLVAMVPNYLSSLQHKSFNIKPGPSRWMAWTNNMMAMFGRRLKPPTLQTTLALHFVPLPVLAIFNAKTRVVIIFNAPIVPLRSTTQNLKVSLKIIFFSLALCHPDLLLSAGSANNLTNALHYVRQKSSTCMEMSLSKDPAFK